MSDTFDHSGDAMDSLDNLIRLGYRDVYGNDLHEPTLNNPSEYDYCIADCKRCKRLCENR
jgi:hypothetical protein